jgi:hypothetical protein
MKILLSLDIKVSMCHHALSQVSGKGDVNSLSSFVMVTEPRD